MVETMRTKWESRWFKYWIPTIRNRLGISFNESSILKEFSELGLRNTVTQDTIFKLLETNRTIIFGGAPNLRRHLALMGTVDNWKNDVSIIAADGAAKALLEEGYPPDFVFTDLDGGIDLIDQCIAESSTVFVLIHSDNIQLVREFGIKEVIYCTQIEPMHGFVNTFGFTDGDRAISFSVCSDAKTLCLGFDFHSNPGEYSIRKKKVTEKYLNEKKTKLLIAESIVRELSQTGLVYTLDASLCPGIEVSSLEDFLYSS